MCQARTCERVRALARVQVLQNSGSRKIVLRFTTLSARDRHWRNPKNKKLESATIQKRERQCTDGLSAMRNGRGAAEEFQHSSGIEPISPDSLLPASTTKPWVRISYMKKTVYDSSFFASCNRFFAYRTVVLGLFKLNIKAGHEIRKFFSANLKSINLSAFDIDWSWIIFTVHNFCSLLIEQLIDLEKVRTDYLKFRTDLLDRVMDASSVTQ